MDSDLKARAEEVFDSMGLSFTTAFTIFTKTVVREGRLPFEVVADPFHSEANQAHLRRVAAAINEGRGLIPKTMAELEAMADA
jgi:DNA-damage-inducible protein J